MLSNIYYALEILPKNNLVETDRSGLVGGYLGQTAIKTDEVISQAQNGILFIDEANLSSRQWSEFEGLFNDPPGILFAGKYLRR